MELNNWIQLLDTSILGETFGPNFTFTKANADYIFEPKVLETFMKDAEYGEEFSEWFNANHKALRTPEFKDVESGVADIESPYRRENIWNIKKPADENYVQIYEIRNSEGEVVDTVEGKPSIIYSRRSC